jgi:hypothetical protein
VGKPYAIRALAALMYLCTASCAGLDVVTVSGTSDDAKATGFRYYEPAPFLFIHSDGKGGLTSEIVWLPDTTQERSVRPYAVLASNDVKLTFANGVLSEASSNADTTAVVGSSLDTLAKFLGVALAAADEVKGPPTAPPPYLYKIIISGNTVTLHGGPPRYCAAAPTAPCPLFDIKLPADPKEGR